jgi:hypothetical protein
VERHDCRPSQHEQSAKHDEYNETQMKDKNEIRKNSVAHAY